MAGYPYLGKYRVTEGIIEDIRQSDKWIRTTTEAYPGNSGGPVLNSKGEVIGIHVGHGYDARPSNALKALLAASTSTEPLAQWQKRALVRAYVYVKRGRRKYDDGDAAGAITDLDKAIKLNPNDAEAYKYRAKAKAKLGNLVGAIADYNQAIKLKSDDDYAYSHRGMAKSELGDHDGAIDDHDKAIRLSPKSAYFYNNRGEAKRSVGDYAGAVEDYNQAIKLNPKYSTAYYHRGLAKEALGQQAAAKIDFEKAKASLPGP